MILRASRTVLLLCLVVLGDCAVSSQVPLRCAVVGADDQPFPMNVETLSNRIVEVNRIFRQVAMSFRIDSVVFTNDDSFLEIDLDNANQRERLYSMLPNGDGLKVFFVNAIVTDDAAVWNPFGIIVKSSASVSDVAHELGHACGLEDVYDEITGSNFVISVTGRAARERMPDDWGRYSGQPSQSEMVQRLLMYGFAGRSGVDISYGDVDGAWYDAANMGVALGNSNCWRTTLAPVGFHYHGNRHPRSEDWDED